MRPSRLSRLSAWRSAHFPTRYSADRLSSVPRYAPPGRVSARARSWHAPTVQHRNGVAYGVVGERGLHRAPATLVQSCVTLERKDSAMIRSTRLLLSALMSALLLWGAGTALAAPS